MHLVHYRRNQDLLIETPPSATRRMPEDRSGADRIVADEGRHLETDRFARSGRKHAENVPTRQHVADDLDDFGVLIVGHALLIADRQRCPQVRRIAARLLSKASVRRHDDQV